MTPLTQCLALMQPHTPSPTSILVLGIELELHQMDFLDGVITAVRGMENGSQLTIVSQHTGEHL